MKKFNKNIGLDNFIIGAALVGGICFLAFQGYLFFSTAQMFVVETTSVVYFALTFTFNFVTVGFLLAHTRDKKSFVEIFERLFLPREILFKPFYFLALLSNMMALVELNQAIAGITPHDMGEGFWLSIFFISFAISHVAMMFFKFLMLPIKKEEKIKTPLDSVFIEAEP